MQRHGRNKICVLLKPVFSKHVTEPLRLIRQKGTHHAALNALTQLPMKIIRLHPRLLAGAVLSLLLLCNSAQAHVTHYEAELTGAAEAPPNASPGTGHADVYFDDVANTLRVVVIFSNLLTGVTAAHIHAATALANTGTASVATQTPSFAGFPSGVTAGSYDQTFDLSLASSFRAGYITANGGTADTAAAALIGALNDQKAYLNIHTTSHPGGEIRGFLHDVPDNGSTALLLILPIAALAAYGRTRKLQA
jgi:hypothetical protein